MDWFSEMWGTSDTRPYEHGPNGWRRRQYSGEELRAIRARNGVGRAPARQFGNDAWVRRCHQVNAMYMRWLYADISRAVQP